VAAGTPASASAGADLELGAGLERHHASLTPAFAPAMGRQLAGRRQGYVLGPADPASAEGGRGRGGLLDPALDLRLARARDDRAEVGLHVRDRGQRRVRGGRDDDGAHEQKAWTCTVAAEAENRLIERTPSRDTVAGAVTAPEIEVAETDETVDCSAPAAVAAVESACVWTLKGAAVQPAAEMSTDHVSFDEGFVPIQAFTPVRRPDGPWTGTTPAGPTAPTAPGTP
jgi:hypothetical protein